MLSSLKNSKLQTEPFKHVVIENFASDEEYKEIKDIFKDAVLVPFYHKDCSGRRYVEYIKEENKASDSLRTKLYDKLDSFEFKSALKEALKLEGNGIYNTRLEIQVINDKQGYKIYPHCDINKYITLLIYCPDDETCVEHGTALYDTSKNMIKKVKYLPNTAVMFHPVNNLTWHGVSEVKENITRKSLQIFYKFRRTPATVK